MRRILIAAVLSALPRLCAATPFVPNDPYFNQPGQPTSFSQWYLDKTGTGAAIDINVRGAWSNGWDGSGQLIQFIDNGADWTHPDLAPNFSPQNSIDLVDSDSDPSGGSHGTATAGLASACGGNGIGVAGIAPHSKWAEVRAPTSFLFSNVADVSKIAQAFRLTPSQLSVKNYSVSEIGAFGQLKYTAVADIDQAVRDSTSAGNIVVTGISNSRQEFGITVGRSAEGNVKSVAHLPEAIVSTTCTSAGGLPGYAAWGANITATAPSGDTIFSGGTALLTTDRLGASGYNPPSGFGDTFPNQDYTSRFTGASASTAILSGVITLGKQAHKAAFGDNLVGVDNTRYYKHLLARTSRLIDAADPTSTGGWRTNAAGYHFNNNYGFGLVDTTSFTNAAIQFSEVSPLIVTSSGAVPVNSMIPVGGIARTAVVAETSPLEELVLRLRLNDSDPNNLDVEYETLNVVATSPSGTTSTLMLSNPVSDTFRNPTNFQRLTFDWAFVSNAFWGENPSGSWSITVSTPMGGSYEWSSFEIITRSGSLITPTPGDANLDNVVNSLDFDALASHYGTLSGATWQMGDFDADGKVTTTDFNLLAGNFGASSAPLGANVPEPAICLSLLAIPMMLRRRG